MTVLEHLRELRQRIVKSVIAVGIGAAVGWMLYQPLYRFLTHPLRSGGKLSKIAVDLNVPGIVTGFVVKMKLSLFFGLIFGLPVILWQVWRFIVPGLTRRERRYGIGFVAGALVLFGAGAFIAYTVLPEAIAFLLKISRESGHPLIFIDQYLTFAMFTVLGFGLSFEFPLLLVLLAGIGVLSSAKLSAWRRQAIFFSVVVAVLATPSQDPYSNILLAVPLYILYELSTLFIRYGMRK